MKCLDIYYLNIILWLCVHSPHFYWVHICSKYFAKNWRCRETWNKTLFSNCLQTSQNDDICNSYHIMCKCFSGDMLKKTVRTERKESGRLQNASLIKVRRRMLSPKGVRKPGLREAVRSLDLLEIDSVWWEGGNEVERSRLGWARIK